MKRIVIYLSDKVPIGYIEKIFDIDSIMVVSTMQELPAEFDYIIIFYTNREQSMQVFNELLQYGINEDKILEYCYYEKNPQISSIERFVKNGGIYYCDSLFLGMSHSFGGLNLFQLDHKLGMVSAPSADLYYHYLVLREVLLNNSQKIKYIYFDLPYYIFNYDVSKCSSIFAQRINFFYFFSDYHHYGEYAEQKHIIRSFEQINNLVKEPLYHKKEEIVETKNYKKYRFKGIRKLKCNLQKKESHIWTKTEIRKIEQMKPHVWYKFHDDTYKENLVIWNNICGMLDKIPEIEWKIVVFPFVSYFQRSHRNAIDNMKKNYYNVLAGYQDRIVDCFDCFIDHPEFFLDECHLNELGRYKFSKLLNDRLSGKV